jgi:hypothetical protein
MPYQPSDWHKSEKVLEPARYTIVQDDYYPLATKTISTSGKQNVIIVNAQDTP